MEHGSDETPARDAPSPPCQWLWAGGEGMEQNGAHRKGAQHGARRAQHPQAGASWRRAGAAETPSHPGLCSTTAKTLPAGQGEPEPQHEADTAWVQACTEILGQAGGELLSPQTHEPHPAPRGTPGAPSVPPFRLYPAQRVPQHFAVPGLMQEPNLWLQPRSEHRPSRGQEKAKL